MAKLKFTKHYILIPLILLVFFLFFFLIYEDIKDRTINEFTNEQLILARTASQGITSFFDDYKSNLAFLSQLTDIIEFTDDGKTLMSGFYENHKNHVASIARVDANGIILYTYPNQSVIGDDISSQEHVREVIATHQPVISDVFKSVQGYLAIAMHVPVFNDSTYVGSLAILIPIDKLGEHYLGNIKVRGTGNVWLMSEKGIELFCPVSGHIGNPFLGNTQNNDASIELLDSIKAEHYGTAKSVHQAVIVNDKIRFDSNYITFYKVSLGNTFWTILISCKERDIYVEITRLRNRLILIFTLLFIVISYYFYSLAKVRNVLKEEEKRKKAERTLRESEEKFRTIFNESPIGIELFSASGAFVNANQASLNMFGISDVSETQNFNLFDGTTLDNDKKETLRKGKPVAYQAIFDFEKVIKLQQYKTSKSEKAYFDYIITPLLNPENNSIDGYLLQVQDITERKRTEEEILMLAHSLRSVNECVTITNLEDKILFVNESFLKTYGYNQNELIGKHIEIIRSPNNPPELVDEILPATIIGNWKGELMNKRKDGSEFPIYLSTTVIKDKANKPIGLIGVASDITNRRLFEEELIQAKNRAEESDRLKSAFLANMSHEIRTPMNGILGFSSLLKEPGLTGDKQQEYIKIIETSGARMLNTINDIIDISKIEAGQIEVSISFVNVNEHLDFLYSFFNPETDKKGIKLLVNKRLSNKASIVKTDFEKLNSILTNLIKNAIKYSKAKNIEFGVEIVETQCIASLQFYVKDNGIGIPKVRQQAIFDRFVQVDIENKQALQGSGLGLAISKAYVEMLGGKIWIDSEPGQGSTFYFTIPYPVEQGVKSDVKIDVAVVENENQIKKLNIVIAEDDETSTMLLKIEVKPFSQKVLITKTGTETVEACRANPDIDLVLMDIQMPGMDGFEAARQIREFNKKIIIIAQTAFALAGDKEKALEAGCNDYISKPINKDELRGLIQKYF